VRASDSGLWELISVTFTLYWARTEKNQQVINHSNSCVRLLLGGNVLIAKKKDSSCKVADFNEDSVLNHSIL